MTQKFEHYSGSVRGKVLKPSQRKEMATNIVRERQVNVRFACACMGISETCYRYQAKLSSENQQIAVGHAFHDANKRTAFATMDVCLVLNGIELDFDTEEAGSQVIKAAQSLIDEKELAEWLRRLASSR